MSGTKRFVEQRIIKRRAEEAKTGELRRRLTEHNILAGHSTAEHRVEEMRRARSEAAERSELFMDYTFVKGEQDKARRTQIAQFEEHLADELARRKAEQLREDMDKRRICDGSEELRGLKERLHMAKVNKERAQQLLEIEVRKEKDRVKDHCIAEHMENERLEHCELEHKLSIEKAKQRERVKYINQQQIAMKEAQREEALQEYNREKDSVNELVEKIAKEDAEEASARAQKQQESREMLQRFMKEQKAKQEAMEREEQEENDRIEQYARDKRAREQALADAAAEAERAKIAILNAQLGKMEARNKEAQELENLRNDLHLEELEAESRRREEMQMRKKLEDREEMKQAYMFQMEMKERKAAAMREEEEEIRATLMKKFAEDDRIEQMAEHKRRMKVEQHKREAERLVQVRREMYEEARQKERDGEAALREQEMQRQVVIESERRRLLQEHAAELKDFLPKGTLETAEDYNLLMNGAQATA
mmetsp:Transcript_9882/g.20974  ORF Transcript_9882/g.20974 Transcript_9882/m.20974 type:complete len:480 (-) Transcript_9882:195-1634(-)